MSSSVPANFLPSIQHYGTAVDALARSRYGISGQALLAKALQGEAGFSMTRTSPAGAKGAAQFMPSSRQTAIQRYGIDPWRSVDEAVHAMELHLRGKINGSTGLEGYNPGDPSYTRYILGQKVGDVHGRAAAATGSSRAPSSGQGASSATAASAPDATTGTPDIAVQLAQLLGAQQKPPVPSGSPLTSPSFSARPVMPAGYAPAGGGTAPAPPATSNLDAALSLISQLQGPDVGTPAPSAAGTATAAPAATSGAAHIAGARNTVGKVVIAPGAERPGIGLKPQILDFLHAAAHVAGETLTVGTGTNHNQYVLGTTRQSDHWQGNAADVPATGAKGDRIAAAALMSLGVPQAQAVRDAQKGGVFTITKGGVRYQVLWKTMVGGNHFKHVHMGAAPQ